MHSRRGGTPDAGLWRGTRGSGRRQTSRGRCGWSLCRHESRGTGGGRGRDRGRGVHWRGGRPLCWHRSGRAWDRRTRDRRTRDRRNRLGRAPRQWRDRGARLARRDNRRRRRRNKAWTGKTTAARLPGGPSVRRSMTAATRQSGGRQSGGPSVRRALLQVVQLVEQGAAPVGREALGAEPAHHAAGVEQYDRGAHEPAAAQKVAKGDLRARRRARR